MIKVKKKRNPSPELYKKLNKLLDQNVLVRFKNNCSLIQVEGKLKKSSYHNIYEVYDSQDKWSLNFIEFNLSDVENINNYTITIVASNQIENGLIFEQSITEIRDALNEMIKEKKNVIVIFPFPYSNSSENSRIRGLLKYDKRDDLYYIKNKNFKSLTSFGIECVESYSYASRSIYIEI